jgi:hypothetical protein
VDALRLAKNTAKEITDIVINNKPTNLGIKVDYFHEHHILQKLHLIPLVDCQDFGDVIV